MCEGNLNTNNKKLCSNPLVWRNASCNEYVTTTDKVIKKRYGMRCGGNYQACVTPWYRVWNGDEGVNTMTLPTCQDKSDQIFPIGQSCDVFLQKLIDFHDTHFCNNPEFTKVYTYMISRTICLNKTQWLEEITVLA